MRKRNWRKYNQSLVQRGSLTFLIDKKSYKDLCVSGKRKGLGRPFSFSNNLIMMLLMIKVHFKLPYRALEGFAKWAFAYALKDVDVPTYSLICKRAAQLQHLLPKISSRRPSVIALDASGFKVYGEGEWKVKIHGQSKRREWLKLHIALDPMTQEIVAHELTDGHTADSRMTPNLLEQVSGKLRTVIGDGAYDRKCARDAIRRKGAKPLVPPPKNGRWKGEKETRERDKAIASIQALGGDKEARSIWGKLTGYSKRSLVETVFSRMKSMYGDKLYSRTINNQSVEVHIKCLLLNQMMRVAS